MAGVPVSRRPAGRGPGRWSSHWGVCPVEVVPVDIRPIRALLGASYPEYPACSPPVWAAVRVAEWVASAPPGSADACAAGPLPVGGAGRDHGGLPATLGRENWARMHH